MYVHVCERERDRDAHTFPVIDDGLYANANLVLKLLLIVLLNLFEVGQKNRPYFKLCKKLIQLVNLSTWLDISVLLCLNIFINAELIDC